MKKKLIIAKQNNQPLPNIPQQDVHTIANTLEQLTSWNLILNLLNQFFTENLQPLDKDKVMREYYVCSKLYTNFHKDFSQTLQKMESQISILRSKEKI